MSAPALAALIPFAAIWLLGALFFFVDGLGPARIQWWWCRYVLRWNLRVVPLSPKKYMSAVMSLHSAPSAWISYRWGTVMGSSLVIERISILGYRPRGLLSLATSVTILAPRNAVIRIEQMPLFLPDPKVLVISMDPKVIALEELSK